MKRISLLLVCVLLGAGYNVLAQAPPDIPDIPVPTVPALTPEPPQPEFAPVFASDVLSILINARTDLETLATHALGNQRPAGWSGSLDVNNPHLHVLVRLDLDLLMATLVGLDNMPEDWFGAVPSSIYAVARDIRHDLELLADEIIEPGVRPPGWAGDDPIMRCDRSTQNLVDLLERDHLFTANVDPANPAFCQIVAAQAGQFAEANLVQQTSQPAVAVAGEEATPAVEIPASSGTARALENIGLAFLNRYATQRIGAIPPEVTFTPVARSFTQFSRMTLVRGDDFEVFVDYKTTTISDEQFSVLPNINNFGADPYCSASWCRAVTFIPAIDSGGRRAGPGGLVNAGTNMVIHYDGDDHNGMTKVRMELCDRPTSTNQAICEPAIEVILPDGSPAPRAGSLGGLTQFYVPYSYTNTSVRSRSYHTADLWIDPPKQR